MLNLSQRSDQFALDSFQHLPKHCLDYVKEDIDAGEEFSSLIDIIERFPNDVPRFIVNGLTEILSQYPPKHIYRRVGDNIIAKYQDSGYGLESYGCVMINCKISGLPVFPADWAYQRTSTDPDYVGGIPTHYHATIKYGLLPEANLEQAKTIAEGVLRRYSINPTNISVDDFNNSPDYVCLVLKFDSNTLTHLNKTITETLPAATGTYGQYQPHITIGYINPEHATEAVNLINSALPNLKITFGNVTTST